jgi:hypothetical protein
VGTVGVNTRTRLNFLLFFGQSSKSGFAVVCEKNRLITDAGGLLRKMTRPMLNRRTESRVYEYLPLMQVMLRSGSGRLSTNDRPTTTATAFTGSSVLGRSRTFYETCAVYLVEVDPPINFALAHLRLHGTRSWSARGLTIRRSAGHASDRAAAGRRARLPATRPGSPWCPAPLPTIVPSFVN